MIWSFNCIHHFIFKSSVVLFVQQMHLPTIIAQKIKFSIKDFFSKSKPQETADLVTFTEEILNGKLKFLCSLSKQY